LLAKNFNKAYLAPRNNLAQHDIVFVAV